MRANITTEFIRKLPTGPIDIWDEKLTGFVVRVRPSGKASYLAAIARGCWHTIGTTDELTPSAARETARGLLGEAAKQRAFGKNPITERKRARAVTRSPTLAVFIRDHFEPWALEHQKRGAEATQRLRTAFADLQGVKLADITPWMVEKWRTERLKGENGRRPKPATVNSYLTTLKTALAKAVAWNLLTSHPLSTVKAIQTDKNSRVRYLSADEEKRLRAALVKRDEARKERRARANKWRRERGYELWPDENPDHLTSIVMLALNTGLRKGEIFGLEWRDVDLARAMLTVRGDGAKSGQTRHVPLNREASDVLKAWRQHGATADAVFPGRDEGESLDDIKKAWAPVIKAAKVEAFTFHDLRHTFASKLVMAGVDLNTVRELLGHADLKMTLRYAHLAPEHKAAAVAKLVSHG